MNKDEQLQSLKDELNIATIQLGHYYARLKEAKEIYEASQREWLKWKRHYEALDRKVVELEQTKVKVIKHHHGTIKQPEPETLVKAMTREQILALAKVLNVKVKLHK